MRLGELLDSRQQVRRERLIGREIEVMEKEALILALQEVETVEDGEMETAVRLLILHEDNEFVEDEVPRGKWGQEDSWESEGEQEQTNRQRLIEDMEESEELSISDIDAFIIGGNRYETLAMYQIGLEEQPYEEIQMLKEFAEEGLIDDEWLDREVESLVITEYEVEPEMFEVEWDVDILSMEIEIQEPAEEVLVGKVLECRCGHYDVPKEFSIRGRQGEDITVKIYGVYPHNIWTDAACLNEDFSELEEICGRDERLLLVEYSTEPQLQLNFYTKDYLDSPDYGEDPARGLLLFPASEDSDRLLCVVDVVPEEFNGDVELELLSYLI